MTTQADLRAMCEEALYQEAEMDLLQLEVIGVRKLATLARALKAQLDGAVGLTEEERRIVAVAQDDLDRHPNLKDRINKRLLLAIISRLSSAAKGEGERRLICPECAREHNPQMFGWRPIESAPKDGTLILVTTGSASGLVRWGVVSRRDTLHDVDDGTGPCAVFADEYGWKSPNDKRLHGTETATHWQPLPSPPSVSGEGP